MNQIFSICICPTPVATPPRDGQVLVQSPVGRLFDKVDPQRNMPPEASILKKKNKNTDSSAPKASSTECLFIDDCYIIDEEKVGIKEITFVSKTPTRSIKDMFSSIDQS
jgi:hypothetical protein